MTDRYPVVFRMFNKNGKIILEEQRVIALSRIVTMLHSYSITRPDACDKLTVEIVYPKGVR